MIRRSYSSIKRWTFTGVPCVLRCGWQLGVEYCDDDPPELLPDVVRMSLGQGRSMEIPSHLFVAHN